jgi:O-antigen ligase
LPRRLQLLLWLLSLNGAFLAVEALLQRASGTDKLLWLVRPRLNAVAEAQLGPFNYRSNGAQYLNLMWPVTLGLWWRLHHLRRFVRRAAGASRRGSPVHHLLLLAAGIMAATSVFSLSRGGAAVAIGSMVMVLVIFWVGWRGRRLRVRLAMLAFAGVSVALGLWLGGSTLRQRFEALDEGLAQREAMYETARRMAADFPWFGTGPGTLGPVFQLYRKSTDEYWPAQLHNDWLEFRVTWGRVGMGLLLGALGWVLLRYVFPGGIVTSWRLPLLYALALGGCLLHARWDFPLQIYSIQQLVLLHCAVLTLFSHPRWAN